jgi:hypothetical protein
LTAELPLRQADPRWKGRRLGAGTSTFGNAACLLLAIDNARHRLTGAPLDPVQLDAAGVMAGAFVGSGAIIEKLAKVAGLVAGPRVDLLPDIAGKAISSYLASGRLILAHVDHDSAKSKGDPEADHWILLHKQAGQTFVYDDSATGAMGGLSTLTLSAPSGWPDHREYRLRAFRTLSKG